jgi:S-formylglutathione hydrolase FrmB
MYPWSQTGKGRFEELTFESRALRDNALGDPHLRPLWVYLPPAYESSGLRLPVVYEILGLTGQLDMLKNRAAFRKNFLELVDELFSDERTPPCIVVFVDCWTSLGGSQFLDSPATGRYHTYLCDEIVPFVDARFRTRAAREYRAIQGKSSGGYGAMVSAMLRPDVFAGFASHAGDALFEVCYLPGFRESARALRDHYQGSFERFWDEFRARPAFSRESDMVLLNDWCMAACYSADADGSVNLPYDTLTGRLLPEIWARWLKWDPVRMAPRCADALRSMRAIWIDCGKRDQFYLDLGAEAFRRELDAAGVTDFHFELFDATHSGIEYRYPLALRYLAERLGAAV